MRVIACVDDESTNREIVFAESDQIVVFVPDLEHKVLSSQRCAVHLQGS